MNCGPSGREIALKPGLILVCNGCCCGDKNINSGAADPRMLMAHLRAGLGDLGRENTVLVTSTACLGPCSESNVVLCYLPGQGLWLGRMNALEDIEALAKYVRECVGTGRILLTPPFPSRKCFLRIREPCWTP